MYENDNQLYAVYLNIYLVFKISFYSTFQILFIFYLYEANLNHTAKHEKSATSVQLQAERDLDKYKEQIQAVQKLEQQMKKQVRVEERLVL